MAVDVGDWVKKKNGSERGVVKSKKRHWANVRWIGERRASACSLRSLIPCNAPRALVLEGNLDSNLGSTRSEESVLRTWLGSQGFQLAYKNIHTIEDIEVIASAIGSNKPYFVHISCHGDYDKVNGPYIILAPRSNGSKNRIYLNDPKTISIFKNAFEGMPILFSACLLGCFKSDMESFQKNANIGKIAAFTRVVYDHECMLFELLIYQGILVQKYSFEIAVKTAEDTLRKVGIKGSQGKTFVRVF